MGALAAACTDGAVRPGQDPAPTIPAAPLVELHTGPLDDVRPVTWQSADRVDDHTLDVRFVANAAGCRKVGNVRVAESAARVTITVHEGAVPAPAGQVCPDAGMLARFRVRLDGPLASRGVADGAVTPPADRPVGGR